MASLATQLETALRPLMFQNRRRLRPADVRAVAQQVADSFQEALASPDGQTAASDVGRQLAERGLGVPSVLTLAQTLRQSAAEAGRLEQAEHYTWHLLHGFFQGYEAALKDTLEGSIQAYRRLQQREDG